MLNEGKAQCAQTGMLKKGYAQTGTVSCSTQGRFHGLTPVAVLSQSDWIKEK